MKQKDLLLIAIFSFVTALAWIILNLYHAKVTSTLSPALKEKIESIEPQFNTDIIEELKRERGSLELFPESSPATNSSTMSGELNL